MTNLIIDIRGVLWQHENGKYRLFNNETTVKPETGNLTSACGNNKSKTKKK